MKKKPNKTTKLCHFNLLNKKANSRSFNIANTKGSRKKTNNNKNTGKKSLFLLVTLAKYLFNMFVHFEFNTCQHARNQRTFTSFKNKRTTLLIE